MSSFRKITSRDKPEALAKEAAVHEEHLRLALAIAVKRARRSSPLVRDLLSKAIVEGLASKINVKASAVSFRVPHLKQTWHQLIPWQYFEGSKPTETATLVAYGLRDNVRRNESEIKAHKPTGREDGADA